MEGSRDRLKATSSVIAHVDMDCFYCAVERRLDPSLNGVAMAVAQYNPFGDLATVLPTDNRKMKTNGGLIAVSYEARAAGVKRSMRGNEACQACPGLVLVQVPVAYGKADIGIYRDAGDSVVQILSKRYKCIVEKASVDEVYLDVTEEANRLLARCEPSITITSCTDSNNDSAPTSSDVSRATSNSTCSLDFCKDILAYTNVLLGGEDKKELLLDKKHLSKGYENTNALLSATAPSCLNSSPNKATVQDHGGDCCNASTQNELAVQSSADWLTRPANVWNLPENRSDRLLICGAFLVQQLRKDLFDQTGYTSSAGIAHTKMLSKVASAMHKPNKMTVIPSSIVPSLMKSLPLNRIKGFGGKLGEELKVVFNIETAGDLIEVGEQRLALKYPDRSQVQNVAWMMAMARGEVSEPIKPVVASQIVSCGKTFRGKMSLPATALVDGQALVWITEMAKELVGRLDDMAVKHDMYPASMGTTTCINLSPRSSSSLNVSKNSAIPPQAKLPGGSYNATVIAQQALSLINSAVEKSAKIPTATTNSDQPSWIITAIFLNATGFTKRASKKQSITSFFKANDSSPNKKSKQTISSSTTASQSIRDVKCPTESASSLMSTSSSPVVSRDTGAVSGKKSPMTGKKRTLVDCYATHRSTKPHEPDVRNEKDLNAALVEENAEGLKWRDSSSITSECSVQQTASSMKSICTSIASTPAITSLTAELISCPVDNVTASTESVCKGANEYSIDNSNSSVHNNEPDDVSPSGNIQLQKGDSIDMDIFRNLPREIQLEIAATYDIDMNESCQAVSSALKTDVSFSPPMSHVTTSSLPDGGTTTATLKVSKGVTVNSIISARVKEKERIKRETSGMHKYFQKKKT
mmetsp:Transcript_36029/g.67180  ORF Transcript_36029/g.67180 Transcript_36029/m.67180 type:complete len:868 (+) Transcript_36029:40-2643(+)